MRIAEQKLTTAPQFLESIQNELHGGVGWVYRGQTKSSWDLRPKAGRPEYYLGRADEEGRRSGSSVDLYRFAEWRKDAVAFGGFLPEDDLECLAYAQHYGLATRLLDWTTNPLVALFFAVEVDDHDEGAVFAHFAWKHVETSKLPVPDPTALEKIDFVALYKPRPIDRRILVQSGVFTYHPDPKQPLEEIETAVEHRFLANDDVIMKFNVPWKMKAEIKRQLSNIGFSRRTLFPDLEGLSMFINWRTKMLKDPKFEKSSF